MKTEQKEPKNFSAAAPEMWDALATIEWALERGEDPRMILAGNSPIRHRIQEALSKAVSETGKCAIDLIAVERLRQIEKGYDAAHDERHEDGELTFIATKVLLAAVTGTNNGTWGIFEKHKGNVLKLRTIAGALVVAEIERQLRLEAKEGGSK